LRPSCSIVGLLAREPQGLVNGASADLPRSTTPASRLRSAHASRASALAERAWRALVVGLAAIAAILLLA
jgi:hypothetical protein